MDSAWEIPNCATVFEIPNSSTTSSMQTDQNAEPVYIATVTIQIMAVTAHFVAVGQFIGFYDKGIQPSAQLAIM